MKSITFRHWAVSAPILFGALVLVSCENFNYSRSKSKKSSTSTTSTAGTGAVATNASFAGKSSAATKAASMTESGRMDTRGMVHHTRAFPTGEQATSAIMLEKIVPGEVQLNQPFEYYLKVTNLTDHALESVVVSEKLGKTFKMELAEPRIAGNESGMASWVLGKLAANATQTIRIKGQASELGTLGSCASVDYASRVCSSINVVQAALTLKKSAPVTSMLCDEFPVEYVVTNTGNGMARNIRITDALPSGLFTTTRRPVEFLVDELGPGKSKSFVVKMKAENRGAYGGMAKAVAEGNLTANSTTTKTTVREPVLKITKSGPTKAFLGREVTYKITVKNVGDAAAERMRVEDMIPAGVKFVRANMAGGVQRGKVTWSLGDLPPNTERVLEMTLRADTPLTMRSTATASAKCAAPVSAEASTSMVGIPAILLEVVDLQDPILLGDNATYRIRVTNQGTAAGTNIVIACTLEDTMVFVSGEGATRSSKNGNEITFAPLDTLAPKKEATWNLIVRAKSQGDVRFKVRMTSDQIKRPVDETEATNFYK